MEHQIDWSATAAWIALAISIISPAITTILANRHQLKLRKLDIHEKHTDAYTSARSIAIENFISNVGKCLAYPELSSVEKCGEHFFQVYAYVPQSLWTSLDNLYETINNKRWAEARPLFNEISKSLACLLKEESPQFP